MQKIEFQENRRNSSDHEYHSEDAAKTSRKKEKKAAKLESCQEPAIQATIGQHT